MVHISFQIRQATTIVVGGGWQNLWAAKWDEFCNKIKLHLPANTHHFNAFHIYIAAQKQH